MDNFQRPAGLFAFAEPTQDYVLALNSNVPAGLIGRDLGFDEFLKGLPGCAQVSLDDSPHSGSLVSPSMLNCVLQAGSARVWLPSAYG